MKVSPPTVTGVSSTTVTITMPSSIPFLANAIDIYLYTTGYVSIAVIPRTQTTYTVTGLTPLTTYSLAVAYQTEYDEGPRTNAVTVTTNL